VKACPLFAGHDSVPVAVASPEEALVADEALIEDEVVLEDVVATTELVAWITDVVLPWLELEPPPNGTLRERETPRLRRGDVVVVVVVEGADDVVEDEVALGKMVETTEFVAWLTDVVLPWPELEPTPNGRLRESETPTLRRGDVVVVVVVVVEIGADDVVADVVVVVVVIVVVVGVDDVVTDVVVVVVIVVVNRAGPERRSAPITNRFVNGVPTTPLR
jgi:hypothetical protein